MHDQHLNLWRAADAVLDRLLDLPVEERGPALAAMPLSDELRERVQRLLAADIASAFPMDRPVTVLAADRRPDAMAGRRIGRWIAEREIGRGGMSVVYRAHDAEQPNRIAALKILTVAALADSGSDRFAREQSILARMNHPHIAPLFDAGFGEDGTPWLAMALVEGVRIDQWCLTQALDDRARVRLFLDVCGAVAYAHQHLVIHRDLKPSNVMVDAAGHVRLLDFGIARLVDEGAEHTATAYRALTPGYAAPEQFSSTGAATTMDVYGLGALLHHLLLGRAPRDPVSQPAADPETLLLSQRRLAPDLTAILRKALAPEAADRYAQVDALAEDLRAWLDNRPVRARLPTWSYRALRFMRRHRAALAVTGLVAMLAIGAASNSVWQARRVIAAQADTTSALARANALQDFLLGLFETQAPGRPRDALPTTAELLQQGESLALQAGSTDPLVRADMLDALTRVRLMKNDSARATALIDESLKLAATMPDAGVVLRARALMRRSMVERLAREMEAGLARLREAEALLKGQGSTALAVEIQVEIGTTLLEQRRDREALSLLEPLAVEIQRRSDLRPRLLESAYSGLAIALSGVGRHREAQHYRELGVSMLRQRLGPAHFRVALALANAANGDRRLGDFARAEHRLVEALSIYDAVLDEPSEYRGSARLALGLLYQASGRFDEAIAALDQGNAEFAAARGIAEVQDYDFYHWNRGIALASAQRWQEAIVALERALQGLGQRSADYAVPRALANAWIARAYCAVGELAQGQSSLADARKEISAGAEQPPEDQAIFDEAEVVCALRAGDLAQARRLIEALIVRDRQLAPGFALDVDRRRRLAEEIADSSTRQVRKRDS